MGESCGGAERLGWYQATGGGLFEAAGCLDLRPLGQDEKNLF